MYSCSTYIVRPKKRIVRDIVVNDLEAKNELYSEANIILVFWWPRANVSVNRRPRIARNVISFA